MSAWTDLVEALRTVQPVKQVVVCEPHMVQQVETLIQREDMSQYWRVHGSQHCTEGVLYIIRDQALNDAGPPDGMLF
jgi:hypothetical protein